MNPIYYSSVQNISIAVSKTDWLVTNIVVADKSGVPTDAPVLRCWNSTCVLMLERQLRYPALSSMDVLDFDWPLSKSGPLFSSYPLSGILPWDRSQGLSVCNIYRVCNNKLVEQITLTRPLVAHIRHRGVLVRDLNTYRDDEITLIAVIQVLDSSFFSSMSFRYDWQVVNVNNRSHSLSFQSQDRHEAIFSVDKDMRSLNETFMVTVTVRSNQRPRITSKAELFIHCIAKPLVFVISPAQNNVRLPLGQTVRLNASIYDLNSEESVPSMIAITWTCTDLFKVSIACPVLITKSFLGFDSGNHRSLYSFIIYSNDSRLFSFYVTFHASNARYHSITDAKIAVELVLETTPTSTLSLYTRNCRTNRCNQMTSVLRLQRISTMWSATLQRSVSGNGMCFWKMVYPYTKLFGQFSISSSLSNMNLSITSLPSLLPGTNMLVFRLTCSGVGVNSAVAVEMDVFLNVPPYGGVLSVSPNNGLALQTPFAIETPGWRDDAFEDYPLQYEFQYGWARRGILPHFVMEPYVEEVILPAAGVAGSSFQYVYVVVTDAFGARNDTLRVSVMLYDEWDTTNPLSDPFWDRLDASMTSDCPPSSSSTIASITPYYSLQQISSTVYVLTEAMATLALYVPTNASAASLLMFDRYRNFTDIVLKPALNQSIWREPNTSVALITSPIQSYLQTALTVMDAYTLVQKQRITAYSKFTSQLSKLTIPKSVNGSLNTAAAQQTLDFVEQQMQAMAPSMVDLLLANAQLSGNTIDSPTLLQTMMYIDELVKVTLAVIAIPPPSKTNNNSSTGLIKVTVPSTNTNTSVAPNHASIQFPSIAVQPADGIVGMLVSVVEVPPLLLTSQGLVAVNASNQHLVDGASGANAALLAELESPKLVSDVVTLHILHASQNGSTVSNSLPVFQLNLSIVIPSGDDGFPNPSNSIASLQHNCSKGLVETVSFRCAQSRVMLNVTCSGVSDAYIRRQCPVPKTACSVLDLQENRVVSNDFCQTKVTGSSVQCNCGFGNLPGNSSSAILALKGKITVAAFSSFAAGDLDSSVSVVTVGLSGNLADKSVAILVSFSCVWGMGFLFIFAQFVSWSDMKGAKLVRRLGSVTVPRMWPSKNKNKNTKKALSVTPIPTDDTDTDMKQALLLQYLLSNLPFVFQPGMAWWNQLLNTLIAYHPYLRLMFGSQPISVDQHRHQKGVILETLHLLTGVSVSCFVLAVLYDLQYPVDDGYCASQSLDKETCEYRKTLLDPWQSRCLWTPPPPTPVAATVTESLYGQLVRVVPIEAYDDGGGREAVDCTWNSSNNSVVAFVISFAITALFSSFFEFILDGIFHLFWMTADVVPSHFSHSPVAPARESPISQLTELAGNKAMARQLSTVSDPIPGQVRLLRKKVVQAYARGGWRRSRSPELEQLRQPEPFVSTHDSPFTEDDNAIGVRVLQWLIAISASFRIDVDGGGNREAVRSHFCELIVRSIRHYDSARELLERSEIHGHASHSSWYPYVGSTCVVAINVGAMYFIVLKAVIRGTAWQGAFLSVCAWEWVTEVAVLMILEIWLLEFYLPSYWKETVYSGVVQVLTTVRRSPWLLDRLSNKQAEKLVNVVEQSNPTNTYFQCLELIYDTIPSLWEGQLAKLLLSNAFPHDANDHVRINRWQVFILRFYMSLQDWELASSGLRIIAMIVISLGTLFYYSVLVNEVSKDYVAALVIVGICLCLLLVLWWYYRESIPGPIESVLLGQVFCKPETTDSPSPRSNIHIITNISPPSSTLLSHNAIINKPIQLHSRRESSHGDSISSSGSFESLQISSVGTGNSYSLFASSASESASLVSSMASSSPLSSYSPMSLVSSAAVSSSTSSSSSSSLDQHPTSSRYTTSTNFLSLSNPDDGMSSRDERIDTWAIDIGLRCRGNSTMSAESELDSVDLLFHSP